MGLVFSKGKDNSQLHSNKAEPTPIGSIIKKLGWSLEALSAFFFRLLRIFLGSARGMKWKTGFAWAFDWLLSIPKDHWTLKTGYFEDLTPAIQVQSLPLEGPRSLGIHLYGSKLKTRHLFTRSSCILPLVTGIQVVKSKRICTNVSVMATSTTTRAASLTTTGYSVRMIFV